MPSLPLIVKMNAQAGADWCEMGMLFDRFARSAVGMPYRSGQGNARRSTQKAKEAGFACERTICRQLLHRGDCALVWVNACGYDANAQYLPATWALVAASHSTFPAGVLRTHQVESVIGILGCAGEPCPERTQFRFC